MNFYSTLVNAQFLTSTIDELGGPGVLALICFGIALAIALGIVFAMKSKHRTAKQQRAACNYVKPGSFNLTTQRDLFLFRNVTRVARPQNNTGGRGGMRRR